LITIVFSEKDVASLNIKKTLIKKIVLNKTNEVFDGNPVYVGDNFRIITLKSDFLSIDQLCDEFTDFYIFVSCHKSESKYPCLTSHFPGNFSSSNSYGGKPKELAYTSPSLQKEYIRQLWLIKNLSKKYQVVIEPTHHGPSSLTKPVLFVEIGSTEEEWKDEIAAETVSKALIQTIKFRPFSKVGIGFGGTHYSRKFTKFLIESEYCIGAIAPKYVLEYVNDKIIDQMIKKCVQKVEYAILDWKGLGKMKRFIIKLVEKKGLKIIKI
jgi:D-aminoacyl-tRNA deacylase